MLVIVIIAAVVILVFIVLAILDKLKVTHIFIEGRPGGIIGSGMQGLQDILDQDAQKAHEYILQEKEEKDKSEIPTSEKNYKKQLSKNKK